MCVLQDVSAKCVALQKFVREGLTCLQLVLSFCLTMQTSYCPTSEKHFAEIWMEVLSHPPYSPDLSPPDFDLFPKFKKTLRVKRFATIEEASTEVARVIRELNSKGVLSGIQDFPSCHKEEWGLY